MTKNPSSRTWIESSKNLLFNNENVQCHNLFNFDPKHSLIKQFREAYKLVEQNLSSMHWGKPAKDSATPLWQEFTNSKHSIGSVEFPQIDD